MSIFRGYGRDRLVVWEARYGQAGARGEARTASSAAARRSWKWHGLCHAWASAALLEPEPREPVTYQGLDFRVGDIMRAPAPRTRTTSRWSSASGSATATLDRDDIALDVLKGASAASIGQKRIGQLTDLDAGPEVWTYPVYGYRVEFRPRDGMGRRDASIQLDGGELRTGEEGGLRRAPPIQRRYRFSVEMP